MTVDVSWTLNVNTERPTNMHTYVYQTTTHVHTHSPAPNPTKNTPMMIPNDTRGKKAKKSIKIKQSIDEITSQNKMKKNVCAGVIKK